MKRSTSYTDAMTVQSRICGKQRPSRLRQPRSSSDEVGKRLYAMTKEADRAVVERVAQVAGDKGLPMSQMALAWVPHQDVITAPIIGASKPHHLEDALAALSLKLTPEEIASLEEPYAPHPVLGFS